MQPLDDGPRCVLVRGEFEPDRLNPERAFEVGLVGDDFCECRLGSFASCIEVVDIAGETACDAVQDHEGSQPVARGAG